MAVFRVERNKGYTVMSNHHLRNKELSLKAKGLLSQMLSLPEDWDYTLAGLSFINREKIDAIREAVKELERAGYIVRSRERDEKGRLRGADYVIFEQPQTPPVSDLPTLENPTLELPEEAKKYFMYEDYGRDAAINDGGRFTEQGYIYNNKNTFTEWYNGKESDIPREYRVMSFPQPHRPDPSKVEMDAAAPGQKTVQTIEQLQEPRPVIPIVLTSEKPT